MIVLVGMAGVALVGAAVAPTIIRSQCDLSSLKPISIGTNSFITASDRSLLGTIPAKKNRQELTLAQMSPWLPKATVAIEDRRFWQHGALDYRAIIRAGVKDIESGRTEQGASTLTQQLARNLYIGRPSRTMVAEADRGVPRAEARGQAVEARDPRAVSQRRLLRQPGLRGRGGRADVLLAPCARS